MLDRRDSPDILSRSADQEVEHMRQRADDLADLLASIELLKATRKRLLRSGGLAEEAAKLLAMTERRYEWLAEQVVAPLTFSPDEESRRGKDDR